MHNFPLCVLLLLRNVLPCSQSSVLGSGQVLLDVAPLVEDLDAGAQLVVEMATGFESFDIQLGCVV